MTALRDEQQLREFQQHPNVLDEQSFQELERRAAAQFEIGYRENYHVADAVATANREQAMYGTEYRPELMRQNDALGYQTRYLELENAGADPATLAQAAEARRYNVATGFNEAMQAMTWDVPPVRRIGFSDEDRAVDGGAYVDEMLLNSLTPVNCDTEIDRRKIEAATFGAWQKLAGMEGVEKLGLVEISMRNQDPAAIGYVEGIDKMQIRYSRYVDTPQGRALEIQPALINGLDMDTEFINRFLKHIGQISEDENLDRTEILARSVLVEAEAIAGAIDFVRLMDEFYELETGRPTTLGVSADLLPGVNYENIESLSAQRYELTERVIDDIDSYAMNLVRRGIEYEEAEIMLEQYQKMWALKICKQDPKLALTVFDNGTYNGLVEVARLEQLGDTQAASEGFANTFERAPSLQGCGATCRLEAASLVDKIKAQAKGLKAYKESGELFVDKKAKCPRCGHTGMLRGGNGIVCRNGECDASKVNGSVDEGKSAVNVERRKKHSMWKSFSEVQAEFEENQRLEEELHSTANQNNAD